VLAARLGDCRSPYLIIVYRVVSHVDHTLGAGIGGVVNARPSLEDSWSKLRWAEAIYTSLRTEIEATEQQMSHRFTVEVDPSAGEYEFYVHDLPTLDPSWGLRIGDCVHNARCALDYLMVGLVALGTGRAPQDVEDVQFPIYKERNRFNGAIGELKKNQILTGWLSRVEELQPFNAGNPSIWGWSEDGFGDEHMPPLPFGLDRLTTLDNIDKHRCILRPYIGPKLWGGSLDAPAEFKFIGGNVPMLPLTEGALVGSVRYETPLPSSWDPSQDDLRRNYPIQVSFNEPSIDKSVVRILSYCLWAAGAALRIFEPVFKRRQPPLLVTTSLPPRPPSLNESASVSSS
jgi:hypothetical protein